MSALDAAKNIYATILAGDFDGLYELMDEKCVIEFYGPNTIPYAGVYRGRDICMKFFDHVQNDVTIHEFSQNEFIANDKQVAVKSVRQARMIMTANALKPYQPQEILPGPVMESEDDLVKGVGDIATTIFHPVGTCKMGSDASAVVGADLRVHGLKGLRVVDASIMPKIVSGNTASPVVMIAEKAADMILGRTPPEAANV